MKKTAKWLQALPVLTIAALLLAACGAKDAGTAAKTAPVADSAGTKTSAPSAASDVPEMKEVTLVGVRDAQISSQQIIADKLGYFKEAGLNVKSQLIESGPDIGPMVAGARAPSAFRRISWTSF
ncbi:hypothetical protein LJK87_42240 [Paenibacillus sp. P25]|nr:hypothetical protein LJK87_42240 [Paenibacillus sp. P25]